MELHKGSENSQNKEIMNKCHDFIVHQEPGLSSNIDLSNTTFIAPVNRMQHKGKNKTGSVNSLKIKWLTPGNTLSSYLECNWHLSLYVHVCLFSFVFEGVKFNYHQVLEKCTINIAKSARNNTFKLKSSSFKMNVG